MSPAAVKQYWHQQPGESKLAYRAFSIYRDMGVERSLDKAYVALWTQTHQNNAESAPEEVKVEPPKEAPRHWSDWSTKFSWVERANAYDTYLDTQLQQQFENELLVRRQQTIRAELADADLQLLKWHDMLQRTQLHVQKRSARKKTPAAGEVDIVFAELNIDDWFKLSRWRGEIGDQLRRALGMPITRTDVTTGGEKLPGNVVLNVDDLADVFKQIRQHKEAEHDAGS